MSYTNKTPYYELPQYIGTDKPTYLGDFNGAMVAIDTAMHNNATAASGAQSTADTANALASSASTQANNANTVAVEAKNASETNATNITALQETVAGLAIQSGTNSDGTYIILPGKIQICIKNFTTQSTTIETAFGGGYINATQIQLGNYAKPFASNPIVSVTGTASDSGTSCNVLHTLGTTPNTSCGSCFLLRPSASSTPHAYNVMIIAIGTAV